MTVFKKLFRKKDNFSLIIERIIGFCPNQSSIYQQAFLHKSGIKDNDFKPFESNERLEFLGDAVLDSIVSYYLYCKFPFKDEGYLTQLRSRLVSRQNLNNLGEKIGLPELIKANLDRKSKTIYGDTLEALIGAIYIDKGYRFAQKFIEIKLLANHIDIEEVIQTETDFKSRVLEWGQKERVEIVFDISEREDNKEIVFTAELKVDKQLKGTGEGLTKKRAEQLAAEQFYKDIQ